MHPEYSIYYDYYQRAEEEKNKQKMVDFIGTLKKRAQFSPDLPKLRLRDNILLFVYDDMMRNGKDNYYLRNCHFLGSARTATDSFCLKRHEKSNNVVAFITEKLERGGYINGEVYCVNPNILLELDEVKNNRTTFFRVEKHFTLLDQWYDEKDNKRKHPVVSCMIYTGTKLIWPYETMGNTACIMTAKNKRIFQHYPRVPVPVIRNQYNNNQGVLDEIFSGQYPHVHNNYMH